MCVCTHSRYSKAFGVRVLRRIFTSRNTESMISNMCAMIFHAMLCIKFNVWESQFMHFPNCSALGSFFNHAKPTKTPAIYLYFHQQVTIPVGFYPCFLFSGTCGEGRSTLGQHPTRNRSLGSSMSIHVGQYAKSHHCTGGTHGRLT